MACKTEQTTIGGHEFSVRQWPADKSMLMKFKITEVMGAPIAIILGEAFANESVKLKKGAKPDFTATIEAGFNTLFSSSPEKITALIRMCVSEQVRDGDPMADARFNEYFMNDDGVQLLDIYKLFLFVVKVNYGPLLQGQAVAKRLAATAAKLTGQQITQT